MLSGKRVLIIDDSPTIRNFMRHVLKQRGLLAEMADSAVTGLPRLETEPFDLVLLDLMLPEVDGLEALRRIRAEPAHDALAVVMLTGAGGVKSAMAASQAGADGYLLKQDVSGGDMDEFFYSLEKALERRAGVLAQKQLEQVKADFYSMITHDLRNPAGSILVALEMMEDGGIHERLAADDRELLGLVRTSADKLMQLITDYLDYAKIEAGHLRLDLAEVDLRDLVAESVRLAGLQARHKSQQLVMDLPLDALPAQADANRLKRVVENLISNAIKYTPEGGRVTVRLRADGPQAVFEVADTGAGIPPEQVPLLFTKYHRVPGETTRRIKGTGLGLVIVKEIVSAHGGVVTAESAGVPGDGSTFRVLLPLAGPAAGEAHAS